MKMHHCTKVYLTKQMVIHLFKYVYKNNKFVVSNIEFSFRIILRTNKDFWDGAATNLLFLNETRYDLIFIAGSTPLFHLCGAKRLGQVPFALPLSPGITHSGKQAPPALFTISYLEELTKTNATK